LNVVGIDSSSDATGRFFVNEFIHVPNVGESDYRETVLQTIRRVGIDMFVSWLNPEIFFWNTEFCASKIPDELVSIFAFNFRRDLVNFCDKLRFHERLREEGFMCPATIALEEYEFRKIGLPMILKPRVGYGSKETYLIDSLEAYRHVSKLISSNPEAGKGFLMQAYLAGQEFTVDFFSENGKVINLVVRERLEHRGVSLRGEVTINERAEALVRKFCSVFGIDGLNNVQMINSEDNYYLTDFNPRPSGTIMLSVKAGCDFLGNLLERGEGKEVTRFPQPRTLRMVRYLRELYFE
jgi:predicted ATP-grasp superfamily ATP-dependent carboligase